MTNTVNPLFGVTKKHPFLWIAIASMGVAYALVRLNIYLGRQVDYLEYLSLFNTLTIGIFACVGIAIISSITGLWKVRFKSIPLALMSLASSSFLILLFMMG